MTPDAALSILHAMADGARAVEMARYHKIDRPYLGIGYDRLTPLVDEWRRGHETAHLIDLAQGLWDSNIFEARIAAAKLFVTARIRPDDRAVWSLICRLLAQVDSWAIGDALAMAGQKRLVQDPARLDQIEDWTRADHLWTRRAALVFTLPYTRARHPKAVEIQARARILGWCADYVADPEWFIQKAVAWWLRDLSKRDGAQVAAFLAEHGDKMKPFARKEAARFLPQAA